MNIGANMSIFLKTTKRNQTFFPINYSKTEQRLVREAVVLSKATVKVACVDLGKMKPVAIPEELKAAFLK